MASWKHSLIIFCALGLTAVGCRAPRAPGEPRPTRSAQSGSEVRIAALPQSVDEFIAMRDEIATTPRGGAATFAVALLLHTMDQELGLACLTIALDRGHLVEGPGGYGGLRPSGLAERNWSDRVLRKPHIARSYFQGTSHTHGYELPSPPLVVATRVQRGDPEGRVFVFSTGADTPRPIALKVNNRGIWKAHEWSSLEVGIRAPAAPAIDDDF